MRRLTGLLLARSVIAPHWPAEIIEESGVGEKLREGGVIGLRAGVKLNKSL